MTAAVTIPDFLAHLPVDHRGLPVGVATGWDGDTPMQGTNNARAVAECILERFCGICGRGIGYWVAFVGDEDTIAHREFMEPPMHERCARWAMGVCPYLLSPNYVGKRDREGVTTVARRDRGGLRVALYITRRYEPVPTAPVPMARAAPAKRIEWFPKEERQ